MAIDTQLNKQLKRLINSLFSFQIVELNFSCRKPTEAASNEFKNLTAQIIKNLNSRLPVMNDEKKRFQIPKFKRGSIYSKDLLSTDQEHTPSDEVIKRLEMELGSFATMEAISNPALHDKMLLTSDSVNMTLRDLDNLESEEDLFDPSDFVQVEQNA